MTHYVFGYGSLIFAPELPEAVCDRRTATLHGQRRSFNTRSRNRFCPIALAYGQFLDQLPAGFRLADRVISLALGTEADPTARIDGELIGYRSADWPTVVAAMDQREGYLASRDPLRNGYVRVEVVLSTAAGEQSAISYLSNPDPGHEFSLDPATPLSMRAKILIAATPRDVDFDRAALKAPGLYYLEGVRTDLRRAGIIDDQLEAIAAAVHDLAGPWCDWVCPAQRR